MGSLVAADESRAGAEIIHGAEACYLHSLQMLEALGFPKGILPLKNLEECGWVRETGFVWMKQKEPYDHFFTGTGTRVRYDREVTAYVEMKRMKRMTGVRSKQIMLWVPITEMSIVDPAGEKIYFKSAVGIGRSFPISAFVEEEEETKMEDERCKVMGQCYARDFAVDNEDVGGDGVGDHDHRQFPSETSPAKGPLAARCSTGNPRPGHYPRSTPSGPLDTAKTHSPSRSTPWRRFFSRPFPPLSPAKHIKAALARRQGSRARSDHATDGDGSSGLAPEEKPLLDKNFGFGTNFAAKYELEKEIGRGHFGYTCSARVKKGDYKGQLVAVKIISKDKMTTAIAIEDVRREVMILKALSHHKNMTKLYDACEDSLNVYIVMELCEGGELLDRILWRGGRYAEEDAKVIIVQILNVIAFFHLQGVVHRDLKPENFLFTTTDEKAPVKIIDFGLSDFVKPDERLNDIVGSAYYVAPEVLHRSYGVEADIWSIGVISYILLCGSRPFWARTESGIFHSVLRDDPNLNESPWPFISPEAKDFVRRLLSKDYRKRMTAVQALTHPWLLDRHRQVPLDILIYKLVKSYIRATPFKQAALKALSKALTETELIYIRSQFVLLEPNDDDHVSFENFRTALRRNATDAMKKSKVFDFLNALEPLLNRTMDFEDFCAATISPYQLEALENWGEISSAAFEYFEEEGNQAISVGELATEMNLTSVAHNMIRGWIRPTDGKLSFYGYTKFLHGVTIRNSSARQHR